MIKYTKGKFLTKAPWGAVIVPPREDILSWQKVLEVPLAQGNTTIARGSRKFV